ncbi:MAG TPA: glycosyltransferase family 39 protein [Solirubrobacteraceae bacterium]|nr:glycosyltransferase family 39 protein [Solirubrobacteraceae bacterium]
MSTTAQPLPAPRAAAFSRTLPDWWPLGALVVLAAALRLSTLGLQGFWFDEAFTPVHVLHPSLFKTLHSITQTENSPPLWYIVEWVDYRLLGTGEWALRLPSALAGIALVPVAWGIGFELAGRAAAIGTAALVTVSPIFVWYSQEARVYGLYALASGVLILCFLRALSAPEDRRRWIAFALAGALALLTHYFTAFLLAGIAVWLLYQPQTRRRCLPALAVIGVAALALAPLISQQGGRNTNWIGEWALKARLESIPQYFLTGYNGASLGHSIELLVALPLLGACALGVWRLMAVPAGTAPRAEEDRYRRGGAIALWLAACGFGIPLLLALGGADYLAPRNVLGAMVPSAALVAVLATWPRTSPLGPALLALGAVGLLAITIDVDLSPRLQRSDWRDLAHAIPAGGSERAYTSVLFGSAPLQHYIPGLRKLHAHETATVREIVETGERPLREGAGAPPAGFHLVEAHEVHGLVAFRFLAPVPHALSEEQLRRYDVDPAEPWVLVPGNNRTSR